MHPARLFKVEDRDTRTIENEPTPPKKKPMRIILYLNAENAFVYLNTILRHDDRRWRTAMLNKLGLNFIAFLVMKYREGELLVDQDEWLEFSELFSPDVWRRALALADRTEDAIDLEIRLLERHLRCIRDFRRVPEDLVKQVGGTAEDILAEIDVG